MDHLNKITRPYINDALALTELSENKKASSYPQLLAIVDIVHLAYAQYEAVGGNAFAVAPVTLSAQANNYLKGHYKSPVKGLSHINTLRLSQEHLTCPMCGSTHRGTLDHLLPQASHPTFAIFSLNLVPACKCNSNRNDRLLGDNPGERILHPYFDGCLSMRLIRAKFEDLGPVPRISVDLCIPATHPDYAAVSFHVRTVVKKRFSLNRMGKIRKGFGISDQVIQVARSEQYLGETSRWDIFVGALAALDSWHEIALPVKDKLRPALHLSRLKRGGEERIVENYAAVDLALEPIRVIDGHEYPLSSGEISFVRFAAQASLHIENGSLLLLDEPETHLHPNFISHESPLLS